MRKCDYYTWEIRYSNGSILTREENNILPKQNRIDPNNPGRPVATISLIPLTSEFMSVSVNVPSGTLPVYARQSTKSNFGAGELVGLIYKVGWNYHSVRHMICVDIFNKKIFQDIDKGGCR